MHSQPIPAPPPTPARDEQLVDGLLLTHWTLAVCPRCQHEQARAEHCTAPPRAPAAAHRCARSSSTSHDRRGDAMTTSRPRRLTKPQSARAARVFRRAADAAAASLGTRLIDREGIMQAGEPDHWYAVNGSSTTT